MNFFLAEMIIVSSQGFEFHTVLQLAGRGIKERTPTWMVIILPGKKIS
jgi:hypothetical protein